MADIFEQLRNGDPVDMTSPEYGKVVTELQRADDALFDLNHSRPRTPEQADAWQKLFAGHAPESVGYFTPLQIDFPQQVQFGKNVFINHHLTMMSIGGITIGDNVQIGPNVMMATDNHDTDNHAVLRCRSIVLKENVWVGANVVILPGVTVGKNSIIGAGSIVTKDVPANVVVAGNPARVLKKLNQI